MTDYIELDALFQKTNIIDEPQYEKIEYIQLSDEQGGVYDSGEISFNSAMTEKNNAVMSESYLALPNRVYLNEDKKIAVKNAITSLIHGATITSSAGTNIVNEVTGSTATLASLKLLIDSSTDFHEGNELMFFGKDENIDPDVCRPTATKCSAVGGVQPLITFANPTIDPFHNPALASRISVFATRSKDFVVTGFKADGSASAGAGYRDFLAFIPLKFIHSFWAQMNFPLPNIGLRWTFRLSGIGGATNYCPWTSISAAAHRTLGQPDTTAPLAPIAAANPPTKAEWDAAMVQTLAPAVAQLSAIPVSSILPTMTDRSGYSVKPSMFIKTVYFRAAEATRLAKMITDGFKKQIVFTTSAAYTFPQTSAIFNQQIATSVIRPTRMWVMPLTTGALRSMSNTFPATIGPNILTNFNIQMNGNNFYNQDFKSQYQLYREFKTQLIGASSTSMCGTPISYDDFLNGMNPYVFDLSRNPTVKSNNPGSFIVTGQVKTASGVDVPTYDLYVIIERLVTCTFNITAGGIVISTVDGADHDNLVKPD